MKTFKFSKILSILFVLIYLKTSAQNTTRPNIIIFLVDDMGWMDTSTPFYDSIMPLNKRYHTPNMEKMAKEGIKFTNAYAQPVCTPSRTSLISGMNASRSNITNWTSPYRNVNSDAGDQELSAPDWNKNGLTPTTPTENMTFATPLPRLLRDAGYYTIHVGKAHWGAAGTPGANPYNFGFLVNISGHAAGHPQSYLSQENYGNQPKSATIQAVPDLEEYYNSGTFLTQALTLETIKAIEVPIKRKEPFFLNLCHYAVHTPFMADSRFVQKYYDQGLDSLEAKYASMIEGMDKSLGELMDYIKKAGVEKNTLIIFMSDNGGFDIRARPYNTHNWPLRSGKGSVYEGGIREPMIVKWPGVVQPNTTNTNPVMIEDFFPTILEVARVSSDSLLQEIDGVSFVSLLKDLNLKADERPLIFHYPHKWTPMDLKTEQQLGINYFSAMRLGRYKLIYSMRKQAFQLYDLQNDIRESNDLAKKYPEKVKKLAKIFGQTLKNRGAKMPIVKATGKQVPYPDEI